MTKTYCNQVATDWSGLQNRLRSWTVTSSHNVRVFKPESHKHLCQVTQFPPVRIQGLGTVLWTFLYMVYLPCSHWLVYLNVLPTIHVSPCQPRCQLAREVWEGLENLNFIDPYSKWKFYPKWLVCFLLTVLFIIEVSNYNYRTIHF